MTQEIIAIILTAAGAVQIVRWAAQAFLYLRDRCRRPEPTRWECLLCHYTEELPDPRTENFHQHLTHRMREHHDARHQGARPPHGTTIAHLYTPTHLWEPRRPRPPRNPQ